jgi:small-conductance mechanosensitive channel
VIGFAAQKTLGNLLAGIQIAITQPIRIDDVVVVEGEWGRIEEITLTYVVVRIWDLRRLVLPIGYFLEKPFQNWTRVSADVLGTVYLVVDYTVPVDEIRAQLERIVRESNLWDRKVCGVQVTDASERGIEVRALVSAADSSKAWDLRCEVREKLIAFLQQNYPGSLPRVRAEIQGEGA